ncbi:MAG: GNAT family N-acetyltransferase [Bdellovibrionales bacterium]
MVLFSNFYTRPLTQIDSGIYRALRERILKTPDARFFSDSYEREAQLTEEEWGSWCEETPRHCILGTFDGDDLIGIIMITRQGDEVSPVVEWEAAWLDPKYRKTGVGKSFYEHARQWTKDHGYKYVVGFIRATYTPALDICNDLGFVYLYTIPDEVWADGSVASTHAFILDLRVDVPDDKNELISVRFQEALPFLDQGLHAPPKCSGSKVA